MEFYLLLIAGQMMLGLAHFTHKLFSRKTGSFLPTGALYSALISLFSLPIFAILAGKAIAIDGEIAFYAILYGVLASLSQVMIFIAFSKVNMVVYSVFAKSSSILVCIAGFTFFGDKVTFSSVLSILLLSAAIVLPLLQIKKTEGGKSGLVSFIICLVIMLNGFFIQLTVKGFTELARTTTERASALYFYANIITALSLFLFLFFIIRKKRQSENEELSQGGVNEYRVGLSSVVKRVPPLYYILIPITATIANIPCVTNAYCLMNMSMSVYMIVLNAAESLVLFSISRFIFREKMGKIDVFSLILSTAAGIVTVF